MKAVILAAGNGVRLNDLTTSAKGLLPIDGVSLLRRQIDALRKCGIAEIVVVVGFDKERVQAECGPDIHFVENTRYHETNSMYSLWLARSHLGSGFVVLNSDVLFHPDLLQSLLGTDHEAALLISLRREDSEPLGAEEMKVRLEGDLIREISKDLDPTAADGENVGIAYFGPRRAPQLLRFLDALVTNGGERDWAPRAFQEFARHHPLGAVSTRDYPWIEIDFRGDYEKAVREIAPKLRS